MRREEYVAARRARSPRFALQEAVATAELGFGQAARERREALNLSPAEVAAATGIEAERLEAIDEGDGPSLAEILWLCRALGLSLSVDADFRLELVPQVALRVAAGAR